MDLTSATARKVLALNKRDVTKQLQVAVRDSQGGQRACWAPSVCPSWWKQEYAITLHTGEVVKSLPFVSQSKLYWPVERARVTLLLYEFRHELEQVEAGNRMDETMPVSPGVPDMASPAKVVVEDVAKESPRKEPVSKVEKVEPFEPSRTGTRNRKRSNTVAEPTKRRLDDTADNIQKQNVSYTGEQAPVASSLDTESSSDAAEGNAQTQKGSDNGELDASVTDDAEAKARKERVRSDITALRKRVHAELAIWEAGCNNERRAMQKAIENKIDNVKAELMLHKLKNFKKDILEMPLAEYVQKYDADAETLMHKTVEQKAKQAHDPNCLQGDDSFSQPPTNSYSQARRADVTATARKASRAARRRQFEEQETPQALLPRTRSQRPSARKAADLNRTILQGSSAYNLNATESVVRTNGRGVGFDGLQTPAVLKRKPTYNHTKFTKLLATIEEQEDPLEYIQDMESEIQDKASYIDAAKAIYATGKKGGRFQ